MRLKAAVYVLPILMSHTIFAQDARSFAIKEQYLQTTMAYRRQLAKALLTDNNQQDPLMHQGALTSLMLQLRLKIPRNVVVESTTLTIDNAHAISGSLAAEHGGPLSWHSFDLGEVPVGLRLLGVKLVARMPQGFAPFGASAQRREISGILPVVVGPEQKELQIDADLSDNGFFAASPQLDINLIAGRP